MKIIVDDKIPYIRETLDLLSDDVVSLAGAKITAADVRDADALIVRTRRRCDEALLAGSSVKFVATATIGHDHIDADYLQRAGIEWVNCPGCNAASVAQYVRSALLLIERDFSLTLRQTTIGIVGCGRVGSLVKGVCDELGMRVLVCDPPREEAERGLRGEALDDWLRAGGRCRVERYHSLADIEREADVITYHVPLVKEGRNATWHLFEMKSLDRLMRCPFIINASRGEVVHNRALAVAMDYGIVRQAVIDTWEYEPYIDYELLQRAYIATPHIAGYSADGKTNADNMVVAALCSHFSLPQPPAILPPALPEGYVYGGSENTEVLVNPAEPTASFTSSALRQLRRYNPLVDSRRLKANPIDFERLRGEYPLRRE